MDLLGPPEAFDAKKVEEGVRLILEGIGEDPDRGGLRETPARVARMYEEIFAGIGKDASQLVTVVEGADYDEMIMVRDIPLQSFCEHHLIPFAGRAHVAYIPNKAQQITGLSKIARVVDLLAKKPQVQERLTTEIAEAIDRRALAARRVRRDRGRALLHDDARDQEARSGHRDLDRARALPLRRPDAPGGDGPHRHALSIRPAALPSVTMGLVWRCRDRELPLGERTLVMGIVNVTPDSFSDGGMFEDADAAVRHGLRLLEEGADVLDVGGESTRPGSDPVSADEETRRVLPVLEGLRREAPEAVLSVDTRKAAVAERGPGRRRRRRERHRRRRRPRRCSTWSRPQRCGDGPDAHAGRAQDDAGGSALRRRRRGGARRSSPERIEAAVAAGIGRDRLCVDPGIGFGKDLRHNLALLRSIGSFRELGVPVLVGVSRKRFVGELSGVDDPADRLEGSVAAAVWCASPGRGVVRVHDVAPTVRALRVVDAIARERP